MIYLPSYKSDFSLSENLINFIKEKQGKKKNNPTKLTTFWKDPMNFQTYFYKIIPSIMIAKMDDCHSGKQASIVYL